MAFVAENSEGALTRYVDAKRWQWPFSLLLPLLPFSAFVLYFFAGQHALYTLLPTAIFFIGLPIADWIVGADTDNPPEAIVSKMSQDRYYQRVLYLLIPAHYALFVTTTWFATSIELPLWAIAALAIGIGTINGNLINIGHELGHKTDKRDRFFAKFALSLSGYGHFTIEHNRGHHVRVATPEDCASARFGESVYAFARRELPGTLKGGWEQESRRLAALGRPFWHWSNDLLQAYATTLLVAILLTAWLGWSALPFIVVHHCFSWYALTQVNYVEHYGLKRQKTAAGRYEPCQPRHSWNANHRLSNLLLVHLQRHSDHHANPRRPYQALRDVEDAPLLPSGYSGCLLLTIIPALWFKVMDKRVLAWAEGDIARVNRGFDESDPAQTDA